MMDIVEVRARDLWPGDILDEGVEVVDAINSEEGIGTLRRLGQPDIVLVFLSTRGHDGTYDYRTYDPLDWVKIARRHKDG